MLSSGSPPYLDDDEINEFLDHIDEIKDSYIYLNDVKKKIAEVFDELGPQPAHHDGYSPLLKLIVGSEERISRQELIDTIRELKVPTFQRGNRAESLKFGYFERLPNWRKLRAYWIVHGPKVLFITLLVATQIGFGVWQLVKYWKKDYIDAFSWRFVLAKGCAGILYPTFFFLILSASRYLPTALRRSRLLSLIFNWDLSHNFHIRIAYVALAFSMVHAIGHLTGTFVAGSRGSNRTEVDHQIGPDFRCYTDYMRTRAGFTGVIALGLFCIVFILSLPRVRRWNFNVFQLGHLLIYPIIGLCVAHGTAALFQQSLFGYFLAFPTLLVLSERISRLVLGFYKIQATLEILDRETVEITVVVPGYRPWDFTAGQYILLQVPSISFFQWHPFTISFCRDKKIRVHIKTDGDWTRKLRMLGDGSRETQIMAGISGPFGAPAQRFHEFNYSVLVGSGVGVTPFSAIVADLQHNNDLDRGGPGQPTKAPRSINSTTSSTEYRRTDFHWIVRKRNSLFWLLDLLNKVSISQQWHRENDDHLRLDLRMHTHITTKYTSIATYIFHWLLENYRTKEHPASPLTGLLNPTLFGRPDFNEILDDHYQDMRRLRARQIRHVEQRLLEREGNSSPNPSSNSDHYKVGVFYCGTAAIGKILADKCKELTIRGVKDGSRIEYHFMIEGFS